MFILAVLLYQEALMEAWHNHKLNQHNRDNDVTEIIIVALIIITIILIVMIIRISVKITRTIISLLIVYICMYVFHLPSMIKI